MLDFEVGADKGPSTFQEGKQTLAGIPVDISKCKIQNFNLKFKWNSLIITSISLSTRHKYELLQSSGGLI